jgi:hypothetical protein
LSSWSHIFNATITYALRSGVDAHGDPTYAAQATADARVEHVTRLDRAAAGELWISYDKVATDADIAIGSRVWLPGAATGDNNASLLVRERNVADSPLSGDTLYELVL